MDKKPKGFQKGNNFGGLNKGKPKKPQQGFQKGNRFYENPKSIASRFKKGQESWIKGKKNPKARNNPQVFKKGERPHNWKGGISPFRTSIRSSVQYRIWRNDVFRKDDWTCQICKIRGTYLEADHYPKLFSHIMNEYKIDTKEKALLCSELWDIENGRTLCKQCHKTYGKRK